VTRVKLCNLCKLTKTVDMFYLNTAGNPQPHCKQCHRKVARESARKRYPERKAILAERKRQEYTNPVRRQIRLASAAAYHNRTRGNWANT
jgi:transposase-like protein